jgi:prophage regulatory protein
MSVDMQASTRAIRPAKAAEKLGIGLSTLWNKAKNEPGFPKPIKGGPRTTFFLETELDSYLAACAAQRHAA